MTWFWRTSWALVLRDWRVRFRRTVLGVLWFLLPLLSVAAAAAYLGVEAGLYDPSRAGGAGRYLARLLAGLALWQLFAQAWLEPLRLSRRTATLLRCVPFDARVLLGAGALSALVVFALRLPMVLLVLFWFDPPPHPQAWMLPLAVVGWAALVAAGAALACLCLPLGLVLPDVRYALPMLQLAWLVVTPVFHEPAPGSLLARVNQFNPLAALVPAARDTLAGDLLAGPALAHAGAAAGVVLLALLAGLAYFRSRIRLAVAYVGR